MGEFYIKTSHSQKKTVEVADVFVRNSSMLKYLCFAQVVLLLQLCYIVLVWLEQRF